MAWWGSELTAGFIPSPTSREKSFKVFQTPCLGKLGLQGLIGQWQEKPFDTSLARFLSPGCNDVGQLHEFGDPFSGKWCLLDWDACPG